MTAAYTSKPVPALPLHDEKLPALPPEPFTAPPPPPKNIDHALTTRQNLPQDVTLLPPIPVMPSLGFEVPLSPVSPTSRHPPDQSSLPSQVEKPKKYSPLTDLIESEKAYVELLTGIIRKVAAAWSRSNLPPHELDVMFRSVEGVYKTNRTLLGKLKEIGENPSSPKALGDLLMRWIDDLEQPYTTYADRYCMGFDDWEPVKLNPRLRTVLEAFSADNPPSSSSASQLPNLSLWTLDSLFELPKGRLHYYKKLYSRLLKSTTPGRSDHRLLTGALGKLDGLLATLDDRANIRVGASDPQQTLPTAQVDFQENPPNPVAKGQPVDELMDSGPLLAGQFGSGTASSATSARGSYSSAGERFSQDTTSTSVSHGSPQTKLSPVLDLERRLATEGTLDIFTMQPKQVRLQMAPPSLPYARELRLASSVLVRFTSKATGTEVIHRRGHVFILSDLFLLCEEMTPQERVGRGEGGPDMHLCYPPLSGKVLSVTEVPGQSNALQVSIMRKETLILEAKSQLVRDQILKEFQECISFARTMSRAAQEPVPPLPPIGLPQSPLANLKTSGGSSPKRERPDRSPNPRLVPPSQPGTAQVERPDDSGSEVNRNAAVPVQHIGSPLRSSSRNGSEQFNTAHSQPGPVQDFQQDAFSSPQNGPASPETQAIPDRQGVPSLQNPFPGSIYPARKSSAGQAMSSPHPSFAPEHIAPPPRTASMHSHSITSPGSEYSASLGQMSPPPTAQSSGPLNPMLRQHASMHSLRQQHPLHHQHSLHHQGPGVQLGPYSNGQPLPPLPSGAPIVPQGVEPSAHRLQKSLSARSLHAQYQYSQAPLPPVPSLPDNLPMPQRPYSQRKESIGSLNLSSRPILPSMQMGSRTNSIAEPSILDPSPPTSPVQETKPLGPVRSVITAQMKCKVFHQQHHAQWKSLGSAKLTLYRQEPTNVKQLVVEADTKDKAILISTIVLTDGVERVGKTGVAIELSDAGGSRTGIIYMIQLRNEDSAGGLYKTLLAGSDRAA